MGQQEASVPPVSGGPIPRCNNCDRFIYNEPTAYRLAETRPGAGAYECPYGRGWHVLPAPTE